MLPTGKILLDPCVLINLKATDEFDAISRALVKKFFITSQVSRESGSLRESVKGTLQAVPVELEGHLTADTLGIIELSADELSLYVDLARDLGDGEAASIAISLNRGLTVATDDHKARRVCSERGLADPVRSTELIRAYCEEVRLTGTDVGKLLRKVQDRASFVPARSDPNRDWWIGSSCQ